MDRRSKFRLDSEVLAVHVCYSFLGMVMVWIGSALRRSEGERDGVLDGRNKECCSCFSRFTAVLLEIANSESVNGDAGLGICKQFARNGALYNGFPGFD